MDFASEKPDKKAVLLPCCRDNTAKYMTEPNKIPSCFPVGAPIAEVFLVTSLER